MNRRTVAVDHGLLRINQRLRAARSEIGTDVSGPSCIFARVDVTRGRVAYLQDGTRIPAPKRFAIFIPPFTLVQAVLERCDVVTTAVAFRPPPVRKLPSQPILLPDDTQDLPISIAEVLRHVSSADTAVAIGRARHPPPPVLQAKNILDAEYGTALAIAAIAARVRVAPAVLSRTFRLTYGMPPVRYRHHLRIMDALLRFAEGGLPAAVFQDVGFDDLSRFYKILRKVACAPPGTYRPARLKNAKT